MLKYDEIAHQIYDQIKSDTQKINTYAYISTEGLNQILVALLESILQKIRDDVVNM